MAIDQQRRRLFKRHSPATIRPPFSRQDVDFTDVCTRCHLCVTACDTGIIKVADGGFVALDFSRAECSFCGQCQRVCQAPVFDKSQAQAWSQIAVVAPACLTLAGVTCQTCRDHCDASAIKFSYRAQSTPTPEIVADLCTGCGACVAPCPSQAIQIMPQTR
ncbi:ferredoxin-type protein NapF [Shewanella sp. NIFS-20-20]|uniref:ferredoxin-type protein NapF n=1 Tax=Shewanella sp. NIFS-20-20 TaxID=2853806 RepID=UPI001C4820F6|nr:ferredoxin-type protein NapF [Shewanella sp. NIFS-20-20]MBV7314855.1 ferredoxin-type protein NapF [Shewanella sp. NIFS-20-20]